MRMIPVSLMVTSLLFVVGCNNAKSPDSVAKDVAEAQQKSSTEVAKQQDEASKDVKKAADKVDDKMDNLNNVAAKDVSNVAIAKAEGDHKVALASCTAESGNAQKLCKDRADADYQAAKANAKAAAEAQKQ